MRLVFGTMNFGPQVNASHGLSMVRRFVESGNNELDAAYVYNEGESEQILGEILSSYRSEGLRIATKVHPRVTGSLDERSIDMQLSTSLSRLGSGQIDTLYLHFPDLHTPVESTLEACARLFDQGKFKELGLSNFPAWLVVHIWHICRERGWPQPKVYQGMYNGLSRKPELELFPALRALGIRFYAYNPLAGGLLTGKYESFEHSPSSGRFARLASYRDRYWKPTYFEAVERLTLRCQEADILPVEAAYRWLVHHSMLDKSLGDGIIIGASSISQLEQNLDAASQGKLPELVLNGFDEAWDEAKSQSPEYFRFF